MDSAIGWRCTCEEGGPVCLRWMPQRRWHRHNSGGARTYCSTAHFVRDFETAGDVDEAEERERRREEWEARLTRGV